MYKNIRNGLTDITHISILSKKAKKLVVSSPFGNDFKCEQMSYLYCT